MAPPTPHPVSGWPRDRERRRGTRARAALRLGLAQTLLVLCAPGMAMPFVALLAFPFVMVLLVVYASTARALAEPVEAEGRALVLLKVGLLLTAGAMLFGLVTTHEVLVALGRSHEISLPLAGAKIASLWMAALALLAAGYASCPRLTRPAALGLALLVGALVPLTISSLVVAVRVYGMPIGA